MEVADEVVRALGAGFDLTSDFRLRFAKASEGRRLVELGEETRDVPLPGGGGATLRGVPRDVGVDKGDRIRFRSDVLEFNQVRATPTSRRGLLLLLPLPLPARRVIGRTWLAALFYPAGCCCDAVIGRGFEVRDRMGLDSSCLCCWFSLRPQHRDRINSSWLIGDAVWNSAPRSSALPDFGNGTPHFLSLVASKITI